jgi:hypothetical protein
MLVLMMGLSHFAAAGATVQREGEELSLDLSGDWRIAFDPSNTGLTREWYKKPPESGVRPIRVPSCIEETREGADYDGAMWYFHQFTIPDEFFTSKALLLRFEGVNYAFEAWLNGQKCCWRSTGTFWPYHEFIPAHMVRRKEPNQLVVHVIDPGNKAVGGLSLRSLPNAKESWYFNYGGIYRPVRLLGRPLLMVTDVSVTADPATGKVKADVTLFRAPGAPDRALVQARIVSRRDMGRVLAKADQTFDASKGPAPLRFEFDVQQPEPWSPRNPALYQLEVTANEISRRTVDFGFRSFTVEGGDFYLNGQPVILKAVLYQPSFPRTFAYPPSPDFIEREVSMMKEAGFNTVRCHAGSATPELLKLCDERGLMVIEEPPIGWVYGEATQIITYCAATMGMMVGCDGNHPSVVAWGTISQDGGDAVKALDSIVQLARAKDPTRPVFGNWPAAWTEASSAGCQLYLPGGKTVAIGGGQIFPRTPLPETSRRQLATLGTTGAPAFVAAIGAGGMPNFQSTLQAFGGREYQADYRLYKSYLDRANDDMQAFRLNPMYGDLNNLSGQAQRAQMIAAAEMIEALRANPNVDGYCYSQWRDAAWESGPGIADVWARPKREWDRIQRANRPLHVILECEPEATCLDRPVRVSATVVNDAGATGPHEIALFLRRPDGQERVEKRTVELTARNRIVRLAPVEWQIQGATGFGQIRGEIADPQRRKVDENQRQVLYLNREQWDLGTFDIVPIELTTRRQSAVAAAGIHVIQAPTMARTRVVLVPGTGKVWQDLNAFKLLAEMLETVNRDGGTILLDCSAGIDPAVRRIGLLDGKLARTAGGFLGRPVYVRPSSRISWLPTGEVMSGMYRSVAPSWAVMTNDRDWDAHVAVFDGYGRFAGHVWAERAFGAGRLAIFTLPVFDQLDSDPVSRLLCAGLLTFYRDNPKIGGAGGLRTDEIMRRFEATEPPADATPKGDALKADASKAVAPQAAAAPAKGRPDRAPAEWWLCGPFRGQSMQEALTRPYPPETNLNAKAEYRGYDDQMVRWKRHMSARAGFINFAETMGGPRSNAVAYALVHAYAPKAMRATLIFGSDDGIRIFVNDKMVAERVVNRPAVPDSDRVEVALKAGWNRVLLKVANGESEWQAYLACDPPVIWSADAQ